MTFTERDLARAIRGHRRAGLSVARVEIDRDGRIVIVPGQPESTNVTPDNEWDSVK